MYELVLLNKENKRFSKYFYDEYSLNKFKSKVKYSKRLTIVAEYKY